MNYWDLPLTYTHSPIPPPPPIHTYAHLPPHVQLTKEVRSIAPFLIPFLKMSCIYFILWLPEEQPSVAAAFVKCLPILSLIWFVCLQGVSGDSANSYNQKVLTGLVFSCIGDALLIWQGNPLFFLLGMAFFGCAQIAYTIAFGFSPFGMKELAFSLLVLLVILSVLLPCLSGLLYYAITGYSMLLALMSWRALARFNLKGEIPWRKIYAACGAALFVASDSMIAVNKFCWPIPGQRSLIMVTYYAAQLCFSLSVINSRLFFRSTQERQVGKCTSCNRTLLKNNFHHKPITLHWTVHSYHTIYIYHPQCTRYSVAVSTDIFIYLCIAARVDSISISLHQLQRCH